MIADNQFAGTLARLGRPGDENSRLFSPEFLGQPPGGKTLAQWFAALGRLHRSVSGTSSFYREAAAAIIDPGGLDAGHVLVATAEGWQSAACELRDRDVSFAIRPSVVDRTRQEGVTLFHASGDSGVNQFDESVICAPVFDVQGNVVAAVYAIRSHRAANQRRGIRPLEALWIQLVAEALTTAHARLVSETQAARTRVLLEQAFPPEVASDLLAQPRSLDGQQREVTTLFADLRESSLISSQLPPQQLCRLLGGMLDAMTAAVMDQGGVIIDYHGDGLAAMWNAPTAQPDHASRACNAALRMVEHVSRLNHDWESLLPVQLRLAVGIHTGPAIVGNTGTQHRIKYGPRGITVNVASRLEQVAKALQLAIVTSAATHQRLPSDQFATRRAALASLKGVVEPVQLFELIADSPSSASMISRIDALEQTLRLFEQGELEAADQQLALLVGNSPGIPIPRELAMLSQQLRSTENTGPAILDLTAL